MKRTTLASSAPLAMILAMSCTVPIDAADAENGPAVRTTSCYVDSDSDGIADCYETNTGVFVSPTDTGTDPANPDTDGDGLLDGDEVNGTAGGLNLPALGVNPLRKDILLEYDWLEDSDCPSGAHSHRPTTAMKTAVANVFAKAPVTNPDGSTGIRVFQDVAPSALPDTHSNKIDDADGVIDGGVTGTDYRTKEDASFPPNRRGYFHYVIFAHAYTGGDPGSSGQATYGGHEMLITLGCSYANVAWVANTIVHELGHNLQLNHGGPQYLGTMWNTEQSCNWKPNYNSVMNYKYQFNGIANCSLQVTHVADYSRGTRRTLNEGAVYEPAGVCTLASDPSGPPPIDWNSNQVIDVVPYALDLDPSCSVEVMHDFDDWANIHPEKVTSPSNIASDETAVVF